MGFCQCLGATYMYVLLLDDVHCACECNSNSFLSIILYLDTNVHALEYARDNLIAKNCSTQDIDKMNAMILETAQKHVDSVYCSWTYEKAIFEKYDARYLGKAGGDGEYEVQSGFGWTNGVTLWMLNHFSQQLKEPNPKACYQATH